MTPARAWVRLGSGRPLDLIDPQPHDWQDRDLAVGLSRTYRWGGHSRWALPLSVAQHSLLGVGAAPADAAASATDARRGAP